MLYSRLAKQLNRLALKGIGKRQHQKITLRFWSNQGLAAGFVCLFILTIILTSLVGFSSNLARAAINRKLPFSALLKSTSTGAAVSDGDYQVTFRIYTSSSGGSASWEETQTISVSKGLVTALLGSNTPLPSSLTFDDTTYYLAVQIGSDAEMSPRREIGAVPIALDSDTVDGAHAGTGANNVLQLDSSGNIAIAGAVTSGTWNGSTVGVSYGGTGATTLTADGLLYGNGTSAIGATGVGNAGECLLSNGLGNAPSFGSCSGGASVTSLNGLTGALSVANASGSGSTVTIDNASTAAKGIAQFNSTNFSASSGTINTIQDIATSSSPQFAGLTLTGGLVGSGSPTISGFGTINGATLSGGTLSGGNVSGGTLTAAAVNGLSVSGGTITSPTITGTVTGSGSPTITAFGTINGATLSGGTLSGGSLSAGTYTGTSLQGTGSYTITGGTASGETLTLISTSNGTKGDIQFFSSSNAITSGGDLTVAGALKSAKTSNQIVLQSAGVTGTLTWTPATSNKTITLPNETGTVCTTGSVCAGYAASGSGVTSLNGLTGALSVANASGSGSTVTIDNASTAAKGIAQFNSTNFSASSGTINTIQDIATSSSPQFAGLTLTGGLVGSGSPTITGFGTINGATLSGGTLNGGNVSGGTLTAAAVNGLSVSGGTITSPTITGTVTGSGSPTITAFGTINGATLSGGTLSGGSLSSGTYTGTSIQGTGSFTITGGTASGETLTLISTSNGTKGDIRFFSSSNAITSGGDLTIAGALNSAKTSNQIVLQSAGVTGTLTWTPATSNKTITLPNETGTVCTTASVCTGYAASGGGTTLQSAYNGGATITTVDGTPIAVTAANTTGNGLSVASSTLTTGNAVSFTSTSTAAASNTQTVLNVATSGANGTTTQTTYGGQFANTHTGTSATNVAGYFTASGGTNNYAIQIAAGQLLDQSAGAASVPAELISGTWFTGGSATTTKPQLLLEPAGTSSTAWSTNGTGLGINAASGFTGNLLDLQVAASSKFAISSAGTVTTAGGYTQSGVVANTFTGASSFTAAGTALSVTNNATISGTLTAPTITSTGTLALSSASNGNITLTPNGTGVVRLTVSGNASESVQIGDAGTTNYSQFDTNGSLTYNGSARPFSELFLLPSDATVTGASQCTLSAATAGTDGTNPIYFKTLDCDTTAKDSFWQFKMPQNYANSTNIQVDVYWKSDATSGNATVDAGYASVASGGSWDAAAVTNTTGASQASAGAAKINTATVTITSPSINANDLVTLRSRVSASSLSGGSTNKVSIVKVRVKFLVGS